MGVTFLLNGETVCADPLGPTETLLDWLREHPKGKVNLKACRALHTAVLQILLAARPGVSVPPADAALARWLPCHLNSKAPSWRAGGSHRRQS